MPEIMKDLIEIETNYTKIYIIDEDHTIGDIVRFAVKQSSVFDVQFILDEIIKATSAATEEN